MRHLGALMLTGLLAAPANADAPDACNGDGAPVGSRYGATAVLDIDGDGIGDRAILRIKVRCERAPDREPAEWRRAYRTRLVIRSGVDGAALFFDEWSSPQDGFRQLMDDRGVVDPAQYVARFFEPRGPGAKRVAVFDPRTEPLDPDAVAASLEAQGLPRETAGDVVQEVRRTKRPRALTYAATARDDVRVAVFVPSLRRSVIVSAGEPIPDDPRAPGRPIS